MAIQLLTVIVAEPFMFMVPEEPPPLPIQNSLLQLTVPPKKSNWLVPPFSPT